MFNSIFTNGTTTALILLAIGAAIVMGLISSLLFSLKLDSSKGFLTTIAILPAIVTSAFIFLNVMVTNDTASVISKIGVVMLGLGLIRFRSAQGKAEDMLALFTGVVIGAIVGLGYLLYGLIICIAIPLLFVVLIHFDIFRSKKKSKEKLLKITIPENLEYNDIFNDTFAKFLKEVEVIGVKTTGMGSMFRLSYRVIMKNMKEEKEFIDEIRTKNGNLEISILPYANDSKEL